MAPGINRPTINARNRSSRWKNPSVSDTPTASASALTWLTDRLTTSVTSANAASNPCPFAASAQNRHENRIASETRSSTESMNAPDRLSSPRWRATDPSNTSASPARMSSRPATSQSPVTISAPTAMLSASDSSVSWYGRTPVHRRNARIPRYGQAKMRCIAPPAAPSLLRGAGISRILGASSLEVRVPLSHSSRLDG